MKVIEFSVGCYRQRMISKMRVKHQVGEYKKVRVRDIKKEKK